MNFWVFCSNTTLGAAIWVAVLAALGYWFGQTETLVAQNLHWITLALVVGFGLIAVFYRRRFSR
jgi:membrane protein DedA with SNARE-associated domain